MRAGSGKRRVAPAFVFLATLALVLGLTQVVSASPAPTISAESYPVVQGETAPLGDIAIDESAVGQLTAGDAITFRFTWFENVPEFAGLPRDDAVYSLTSSDLG